MKIKLDNGAYIPIRAHETDAGMDLRTPTDFILFAHSSVSIDTGVHIELPHGTVGLLKSKSGLNVNHGITSEGVIDEGYSGSICVKLYNNSDKDHEFASGDKITQLLVMPVNYVDIEIVDNIESGERGNNGFGSTGA